jgi:hypothetical protein
MFDVKSLVPIIAALTPDEQALLSTIMRAAPHVALDDPRLKRCPLPFLQHCIKTGLLHYYIKNLPTDEHPDRLPQRGIAPTVASWAAWRQWVRTHATPPASMPRR